MFSSEVAGELYLKELAIASAAAQGKYEEPCSMFSSNSV